ncbi:MAG TPA: ArgE/DapE family deacylase [Thermodesulfobacteriota bacterium]
MHDATARVFARIDENWPAEVAFLREIVSHRSELFAERSVQLAMRQKLAAIGLEVDTFDADVAEIARRPGFSPIEWGFQGRPQVVGIWKGRGGGKTLVLNGHADIVPIEPVHHWTVDPLAGIVRDGRMYGRGTQDMKGGVAAMTFAVQAIREAGIRLKGDLLVQSVIEEEATGNGTLACIARGYAGDAALIPEPFDQKILIGHVGVLWVRAVIRGRAGHAMGASKQVNAIDQMVKYHGWLRALEREWNARRHPAFAEHDHPLNFNPGVVQGGVWPSSVPSEVTLVTRFACYPDVTPDEAKREFLAFMAARQREDEWFRTNPIEFTWYGHHDHGYVVPKEDPFIQQVARAHTQVTGRPAEYTTVTGVTDTRFWAVHLGKPATCYGPIGGNLHAADEWVDLESVREVTRVIASVVLDFCGVA